MPDPAAATETQLRNIKTATGMSVPAFAAAVTERGVVGHARIVAFLKAEYGLSHGNANAVALKVRELAAGGPASSDALLDAQYAGAKAALRPIYERLASIAPDLGPDVEILVQKTGVSFRRHRQFAVVQAASAKRVQLGLNLGSAPDDPRVVATPGAMCAFRVDLPDAQSVDAHVVRWLREAYERADGRAGQG
jgi:predicted transport protein